MKKYLDLAKKKRCAAVHRDLDPLFGRWSREEFDRIQAKIDTQRQIDAELWL